MLGDEKKSVCCVSSSIVIEGANTKLGLTHAIFKIPALSFGLLAFGLCGSVLAGEAIPELTSGGNVYKSEGPTDRRLYAPAHGVLKAVMIFVDFAESPGTNETRGVGDHLLGSGQAQQFFKDTSCGKLSLEVTEVRGWRRMPKPAASYVNAQGQFDFQQHRAYITDACALFPEVEFARFQIVYVVAVNTATITLSPAFNALPGEGARTAHGEVRLAVTFGHDSYRNRPTNLIHETGHLLGLPDLYRYGGGLTIGPWDLMCDIFKGTSFLGWHRHKLGWLPPAREAYLTSGTRELTLTPLTSTNGVAMAVIPFSNPAHPSKVLVAEIAQPILGSDGEPWGEGVLIYSVDARIPTGRDPVEIYPKERGNSPVYGRLYLAPFAAGDTFGSTEAPATIRIQAKQGQDYVLRIAVKSETK